MSFNARRTSRRSRRLGVPFRAVLEEDGQDLMVCVQPASIWPFLARGLAVVRPVPVHVQTLLDKDLQVFKHGRLVELVRGAPVFPLCCCRRLLRVRLPWQVQLRALRTRNRL